MSTKATGNKKHLTLADRAAIETWYQPWGKFHADCLQNQQGFFYHFQGDSASPFPGSSFSKRNPAEALRMRAFSECVKQHICGNQTCNSLCWEMPP